MSKRLELIEVKYYPMKFQGTRIIPNPNIQFENSDKSVELAASGTSVIQCAKQSHVFGVAADMFIYKQNNLHELNCWKL